MENAYGKVKAYYNTLRSNCQIFNATAVDFREDGIYIGEKLFAHKNAVDILHDNSVGGYAVAWVHISLHV